MLFADKIFLIFQFINVSIFSIGLFLVIWYKQKFISGITNTEDNLQSRYRMSRKLRIKRVGDILWIKRRRSSYTFTRKSLSNEKNKPDFGINFLKNQNSCWCTFSRILYDKVHSICKENIFGPSTISFEEFWKTFPTARLFKQSGHLFIQKPVKLVKVHF